MSSVQIEQKSYEMPPRDGFTVTHFTQSVTLTNTGNATLSISAILAAGAFNGDFRESNDCPTSLASGAKCSVSVTFQPTGTGTRNANLLFIDNAGNTPQSPRV